MTAPPLFCERPFWAKRFGVAPFLPRKRSEMDQLGWEACDVVIVTGDAYVDHPSFGMAIIGRLLEHQGFRVGILDQPDWHAAEPFRELGEPSLFFGVTSGNMDSLVNHYTSDKKLRSDDAYTPGGTAGKRPDRASIVYTQRCREAYPNTPVVLGGIEASLRRLAHYDYWSDKVRRSLLVDSGADILVYGNAERAILAVAHRLARGQSAREILDVRGTAVRRGTTETGPLDAAPGSYRVEHLDRLGKALRTRGTSEPARGLLPRDRTVLRLASWEEVRSSKALYAHTSRAWHQEQNPHNARCLVQRNGDIDVWVNPPALPLTMEEMDQVYGLPYQRTPHPDHAARTIPAYDMIRFSVTIMRGCFGGCSFCSITEHEGRIVQSRSESSILRELETFKSLPGFSGQVSDLGGPTANLYRLGCRSQELEERCRKPSCLYPKICENLNHDHGPLIQLYRHARAVPGVKKIAIGSGLRYDLAVESPLYIRELVTHHVGGYLKIAPEHVAEGPLALMRKPGIAAYRRFKALFDRFSREAGKRQYLIPYFIAAHPGTTDQDMLDLALWLKQNDYRADQVQAFLPSPMSMATAMYYSGKNPLHPVEAESGDVATVKTAEARRLHKAFLRYHDPENWPLLRQALVRMGQQRLIGVGPKCLVPSAGPANRGRHGAMDKHSSRRR